MDKTTKMKRTHTNGQNNQNEKKTQMDKTYNWEI